MDITREQRIDCIYPKIFPCPWIKSVFQNQSCDRRGGGGLSKRFAMVNGIIFMKPSILFFVKKKKKNLSRKKYIF